VICVYIVASSDDVVCVTVKRVVNYSGPQIANCHPDLVSQHAPVTVTASSDSQTADFALPPGVSERISSMETHVKLYAGK